MPRANRSALPCLPESGMNWGKWMAFLMALESAVAMVYYGWQRDWRLFAYWAGCTVVYAALVK